jgi:hypothetical protein
MRASVMAVAIATATALVAGLALAPELALAASAGDKVGELIRGFVGPIMLALAAAIGIAALVKRDIGMALTLLVLVIILSGFLMDDSPILDVADDMWQELKSTN